MSLGTFDRPANVARLADGIFDILVVGGGITGAGVALDAAARGLRVALVERDDFAAGTSSRSSKLVHGGLRYLQNGDVRLVYEALHERQRLLANAPHLVKVMPFLIPIFEGKGGVIPRKVARALGSAMWMYDATGGARIGRLHRRLRRDAALAHMPTLDERLAWAYLYYDAQTDDARLTLAVARTAAVDHGAAVVNHAAVTGLVKEGGRVAGALVDAGDRQIEVRARAVVNATGVWTDEVRSLDEGTHPGTIRPAKGVHITVPWHKVRNDIAAVVPVPRDRRSIFVVPWAHPDDTDGTAATTGPGTYGADPDGGFTYIGTTDTDYTGPLDDPRCNADDVAYLLGAINRSLREPIDESDVVSTWAGLRPLVKANGDDKTADLSRRHHVTRSTGGMVTVTGGKLTTYREMAQDAVDATLELLDDATRRRARRHRTAKLRLRGAEGWADEHAVDAHLAGRHGGEAGVVRAMIATEPALGRPLVPGLPYRRAEALYAARYEMATTLVDVLARRTRATLLDRAATSAAAADAAALVGGELGWSDAERASQTAALGAALDHERATTGHSGADVAPGPP